jgi:valyl-tRNA synthetase
MADLRFDAAASAIYRLVWDTFCDWYLELIKGQIDDETRAVAGWTLDQILVLLHPFMPFITEELWHAQGARPYELIVAHWPEASTNTNPAASAEVEWLIDLTRSLRTAKNELGLPPGAKLEAWLATPSDTASRVLAGNAAALERVARLSAVNVTPAPEGPAIQVSAGSDALVIPLEGLIDVEAEKARLTKALAVSEKEAASLAGRLGNASFVERAKPEAVEKARADHAQHAAEAERIKAALERLG